MAVREMSQIDLAGKRVLIREDLNVPIKDGVVTSDARLRAALPIVRQVKSLQSCTSWMQVIGFLPEVHARE